MSTIRGYNVADISADTGEVVVIAKPTAPSHLPGEREDIVTMRMRMKVNVVDPAGAFTATVRWSDGNQVAQWDVGLATTDGAYLEAGHEAWMDSSRDLTIQVVPLAGTGSVDVLLDYVEL